MKIEWIDGFEIKAVVENGEMIISANKEGLLSLAKQLTVLAGIEIMVGSNCYIML